MFDNIPQEMKQLDNWVCFKFEVRNGKETKVPYNPKSKRKAKTNDKKTWASFTQAIDQINNFDGIGFMFSDSPFVGIDLDHCIENGVVSDFALSIVKRLNSYTEYSPSGTGLHIICQGNVPPNGNKNSKLGLEIYSEGRYFTVTGKVFERFENIVDSQASIGIIHQEFLLKKSLGQNRGTSLTSLDTNTIISLASNSKQGEKFQDLYSGKWQAWYSSQSEADLSLCNMLAFWTGRNPQQMDAIFRISGLMRDKWDNVHGHDTYGNITIDKAIGDCLQVYNVYLQFPITDNAGKPLTKHWKNTEWLCNSLGIQFKYNLMSKKIDVEGSGFQNLTFDSIVTEVLGMCHANGFKIIRSDLIDHIGRIAEANDYNPAVDYLNNCLEQWDGKSRIEQLFNCFELNPDIKQNRDFLLLLFEKWLITCVRMAFNDGSQAAQGILILQGEQGLGKTRWLYYILPVSCWGKDGVNLDPDKKDDLLKALGYWIVELGEIRETIKKELLDRLKAFITENNDVIRLPYARTTESRPRTTAFFGSVNNADFLKDDTGERRFWVIGITRIIPDPNLDLNQLWGEVAYKAIVEKIPHWLTKEEIQQLNVQNEQYKKLSAEEQVLLDYLDWDADKSKWQRTTASDLCLRFGFASTRNVPMGRALRRLAEAGYGVIPPVNNRDRRYTIPPMKNIEPTGVYAGGLRIVSG